MILYSYFFCMLKLKTFSGRCPKSSLFQYTSHWFGQSIQMSPLTVHLSPLECRESLMHHLNRRYCSAEGPCVSHSVSDSTEANCPLESHTGLKDTCTFNVYHLCVLNLNLQSGVHFYPAPWPQQWSLVQNAFEQWGKCGDTHSTLVAE